MYHVLDCNLAPRPRFIWEFIFKKAVYRVCRDNAEIHIIVPHPRH